MESSEQQQQTEAASSASHCVASVHDVHDVSAGAAHAECAAASSVEGVRSDLVQHDDLDIWYSMTRDVQETTARDEGACSSMEHEERTAGSGDAREGREGDERESGAQSEEEEAAKGKEREGGSLAGSIKKKKPKRGRRALEIIVNDKTKHGAIGLSTRSRRLRHCPLGRESGIECARAHDLALVQSGSTWQLALSPPLPSLSVPGRSCSTTARRSPSAVSYYGVP